MNFETIQKRLMQGVLAAGLLAGGTGAALSADTLYDRLGGMDAIEAVVDQFFINNFADERIATRWGTADLPRLKGYVSTLVCDVTGGPCVYSGSSMEVAHDGMNVTEEEFGWTAESLAAALDSLNVPEQEKGEMLTIVGSLKDQIVGK